MCELPIVARGQRDIHRELTESCAFVVSTTHTVPEHREDRERQIVEQLKAGRTKIADMVPIMYAAVDKRLYPAAARSVLAHMEHLVATGIVATDGKPSLASDYRLA